MDFMAEIKDSASAFKKGFNHGIEWRSFHNS